jgi:hypothetical protein
LSGDRRRYPRSRIQLQGVQHLGNRRIPCTVTDLSSGGFFIEKPSLGRPGELVVMEFNEPEGSFRVTGEVAYVTERGAGVCITRADWQRLTKLFSNSD